MRITPLDIRKQPFRRVFRGFDPDEVNSFLEMVAGEFETIIRSNDELATQAKVQEGKLEQYVKIEKTLHETLLTAQKSTDSARANAQKESELIIKDAQLRADRYEDDARKRVHAFESELISLKNQRDSFLARFRSMLKTQLELLNTISADLGRPSPSLRSELVEEETLAEVQPQRSISSMDVIGDASTDND